MHVRFRAAVAATAIVCLVRAIALGDDLSLSPTMPDIQADSVNVTYDADTHELTASGRLSVLHRGAGADHVFSDDYDSSFQLDAYIDNGGKVVPNSRASLSLKGDTLSIHPTADPELYSSSQLETSQPNFNTAAPKKIEFLFQQDSAITWEDGTVVPAGTPIGVILANIGASDLPSFAASFQSVGSADAFTVPEPASALVILLGVGSVACSRSVTRGRRRVRGS